MLKIQIDRDNNYYIEIHGTNEKVLSFIITRNICTIKRNNSTLYYKIIGSVHCDIWGEAGFGMCRYIDDISDDELLKKLLQGHKITQEEYLQLLLMVK